MLTQEHHSEEDPGGPAAEYEARLAGARATLADAARRDDSIANTRLWVFFGGIAVACLGAGTHWFSPWWALAVLAAFIGLVIAQAPAAARRGRAARLVNLYEAGLRRLEGRWQGKGISGSRFANADRPYSDDLDLFGEGSLFELLCTCRTRAGEDTLAAWLLAPAAPQEIASRQAAVDELRSLLDLREEMATAGDDPAPRRDGRAAGAMRSAIDPAALAAWASAPVRLASSEARIGALAIGLATVASAIVWAVGISSYPFWAMCALSQSYAGSLNAPAQKPLLSTRVARDLDLLAALMAVVERQEFQSPLLARVVGDLRSDGALASTRIAELQRLAGLMAAPQNQLFRPIAALLVWKPQVSFAIEAWRAKHGPSIGRWLAALGVCEALSALAAYAYEHPEDVFAQIEEDEGVFDAKGLAHPLLLGAVPNDVFMGGDRRLLIVSGSNMSGKSTLLRAIGVNTVLALAGAPVRARSLRLGSFLLGTSIRMTDSLKGGISRFYAEITRIRQVVQIAQGAEGAPPALFLLDEILHGTNSHDRLIGAEGIARSLVAAGAVGLITTHDLALARLADDPRLAARNVHFEDHMEGGRMAFDYKLRDGVVTRSNAIALMRAVGLDV